MTIQPLAILILNVVYFFFIMGIGVIRLWMIRSRQRTTARTISEVWALAFMVFFAASCPVAMYMWVLEMKGQKAHPGVPLEKLMPLMADETFLKLEFAVGFFYATHMWTLKAAFIALLYDLRVHLSKGLLWMLYAVTAYTAFTFVANVIFLGAWCTPIETVWVGECSSILSVPAVVTSSWFNITSDAGILFLGVMIIQSLTVRKQARKTLWVLPAIGSISMVATFVRFILSYRVARKGVDLESGHELFVYAWVEVTLAWLAFTLPAIRAMGRERAQKKTSNNSRSGVLSQLGSSSHNRVRIGDGSQNAKDEAVLEITIRRSYDVEINTPNGSDTELNSLDVNKPVVRL